MNRYKIQVTDQENGVCAPYVYETESTFIEDIIREVTHFEEGEELPIDNITKGKNKWVVNMTFDTGVGENTATFKVEKLATRSELKSYLQDFISRWESQDNIHELCEEYCAYCRKNLLPIVSADEQLFNFIG